MTDLPDIEIYLKRVETDDILRWLSEHFEVGDTEKKGDSLQVSLKHDGSAVTCMLLEGAARGGYTSIWFRENKTPWPDDATCAQEAFKRFHKEVRYANGSWDNQDDGGWVRLTSDGESIVNWKT